MHRAGSTFTQSSHRLLRAAMMAALKAKQLCGMEVADELERGGHFA
jgi:hypothetical protein